MPRVLSSSTAKGNRLRRICVFCGSSSGRDPAYAKAAESLGRAMVEMQLGLVYGGARVGLMGRIAQTVLDHGGEVIGVMPSALVDKEVAFEDLSDLRIVDSMHERKAMMADLSDGFVALPGGLGTLEELLEILTWAQLGIHDRPCGVLNVNGYFDRIADFLDHAVDQEFILPVHREMVIFSDDAESLLTAFQGYRAPTIDKASWILGREDS
jgi:uncharacterized protein (TIGR00730 family)